jgi:phosphoglycolate phosphatase
MFKNIKLIIFDLDGTMINSAKDIMISNNLTLKKFGFKPISYQNVKSIIGQGIMANIIKSLHMQKISPTEQLKKKMYKFFFLLL